MNAVRPRAQQLFRHPSADLLEAAGTAFPSPGPVFRGPGAVGYVHVPFCPTVCSFCNVYKEKTPSPARVAAYLERLAAEIREKGARLPEPVAAAYVGGGTPSALSAPRIASLLAEIRRSWRLAPGAYLEFDASPATLTPDRLAALSDGGVTHLTIGVQSLDPKVLGAISRGAQTRATLDRLADTLRAAGMAVHFDYVVGLPGETPARVLKDVEYLFSAFRVASFSVNAYDHAPDAASFGDPRFSAVVARPSYGAYVRALVTSLERHVRDRHGVGRGDSPYFSAVRAQRSVVAAGAGAWGRAAGAGAYRNPYLEEYLSAGPSAARWYAFAPGEEAACLAAESLPEGDRDARDAAAQALLAPFLSRRA